MENRPRSRERLHRAIQAEVRDAAPDVLQERRALVLAGPPGAGKGGVKADVLGDALETYRNIDADEFKAALLAAADRDGSFEGWLKPEAVRDLETQGEQFFPPRAGESGAPGVVVSVEGSSSACDSGRRQHHRRHSSCGGG